MWGRLLACFLWSVTAHAQNNAAFVSQEVPAVMVPGQTYAVSVTLQNNGFTTWTPGASYRLGSQNPQDNTTWGANRVNLPSGSSYARGAYATFSFNVTAPKTAGTYNFQWQMVQDGVGWFGAQTPNVAVKVGLNDAAFASQSVAPVMTPGQSYAVTVTMKNTGGSTWSPANYRLASKNPPDNLNWGVNRVTIPATTAPGASSAIAFNVTAPTTPGTYNFQWQMGQTGVEFFGAFSTNLAIKVGLDNAAFVSQSVPSSMVAGVSYPVSVTLQNSGSTTWAAGTVGLGSQEPAGTTRWGPIKVALSNPVAPGAQATFNFNVTAPAPGTHDFRWRMVEGADGWFGAQSTNVAVNVAAGTPDANAHFIHTDHLNTARLVANTAGQATWRWEQHEPFGTNAADENPSGLGTFELALRFPGQYFDTETSLHYNWHRDYDPAIGRYIQSDPSGLMGGINSYLYALARPLQNTDPFGLYACPIPTPPPVNATPAPSLAFRQCVTTLHISGPRFSQCTYACFGIQWPITIHVPGPACPPAPPLGGAKL